MKKVLILVLALGLGACEPFDRFASVIGPATVGIEQPISRDTLADVESGFIVVFAALNAYKESCVRKVIPQSCRNVIEQMQAYTVMLPPLIRNLRMFVKNNDQVNALTVYRTVTGLMDDLKAVGRNANVPGVV